MDSMDNRKEETIKMLKEINSPRSINMIYGFVRAAYKDEKEAVRQIEDIEERGMTHNE